MKTNGIAKFIIDMSVVLIKNDFAGAQIASGLENFRETTVVNPKPHCKSHFIGMNSSCKAIFEVSAIDPGGDQSFLPGGGVPSLLGLGLAFGFALTLGLAFALGLGAGESARGRLTEKFSFFPSSAG